MKRWPLRDYGEACAVLRAQSGYRLSADEIRDDLERRPMARGIILDMPSEYFLKPDAALLRLGYTAEQLPWIDEQLSKLDLTRPAGDEPELD